MKSISKLNEELGNTFSQLHYAVIDYIEKHQKEKGYINTQNGENDTMYFYAYNDYNFGEENGLVEGRVCAIRVKGGGIQILGTIHNNLVFTENDIENATKLTDNIDNANGEYNPYLSINGEWETYWQDIYGGDTIIYAQTLMSIAESIEQYQ
jgi:hypothetical protein